MSERDSKAVSGADEPVEILMAVYNGEKYLAEQIDSILAQTDPRWRLTISDDGSVDSSPRIIDDYVRRHPDRIRRLRAGRRFGGARDHFFYLMGQCDARYMLFCDQDDVWYPNKILKTRQALEAAEARYGEDTPILVFSDQTPTDANLTPLAPSLMRYQKQYFGHFDYRAILFQNVVTGGAMGINRPLAILGGYCTDTSQVIMHDWWLAAVAARFGQIVYIDECLGAYRQHGGNEVGAKDVGSLGYVRERLKSLSEVRKAVEAKKRQARMFQTQFESVFHMEDMRFLDGLEKPRSGFVFYVRYRKLIHGWVRKIGFLLLG